MADDETPPNAEVVAPADFLGGDEGLAGLIRAHDWSSTAVGALENWPPSLKAVVAMLLRSMVPMVLLWGRDGVMIYNDAYAAVAGGRHPQLLGMPVREGWPEIADFNDHVLKVGLSGKALSYKNHELTLHRNGRAEQVWMNLDYSPVVDEQGQPAGVIAIVHETSQAVRAEQALRTSEFRFHAMANSIDQMIWSTRPDGFHDYYNQRWYDYTGVPDGSTDGEAWNGMFHPEDQARAWEVWRRSLERGEPYHIEYRLRHRSGEYRWVIGRAQPVRDESGAISRWFGTCTDIHDLKLAEEARRESDERYRALFNTIDEGFCVIEFIDGPDGPLSDYVHVEANPAYQAHAGFPDIVGKRLREIVSDTEADAWAKIYRDVLETGTPVRFERELVETNRHLELAAFRVGPAERRQVAVLFQDITGRRRAESALRESEARFRAMADSAPAPVWVTGPDGIEFANKAFGEMAGLPPEQITGDGWISLVHPDDLPDALARRSKAWADRGNYEFDARFRRADGAQRWMRVSCRARLDPAGELIGFVGIAFDTTELREAQETAESNAALLRAVGNATPDLIYAKDRDGRLIYANAATATVLGRTQEEVLGLSSSEQFGKADEWALIDEVDRRVMDNDQAEIIEEPYTSPDGRRRVFRSAKTPMRDAQGSVIGLAGVSTDITALKDNEAKLRELNETLEQRVAEEIGRRAQAEEALRQAQKMETLGQLTGGVAHDFNNLLQIVLGNIGLIQRGLPDDAGKLRRAAENAARGAERAAILTQRLLAFSRRQPLAPKPIDPNRLVGGMSDLLHRTLGETIDIETVLAPRLWPIEADPNQLENAILNLAVNGRDAMPDGGKLTIETCNTHLDHAYVAQMAEVSPGQYVCVSVSDTGVGMDQDTANRAFEPFFTTKDVGKGTGLGLSMVYGFVKQSGGHLRIYSEPGVGTTVKIYLPRLTGAKPDTEDAEEVIVPEGVQSETILVCEDDDDVRAYTVEVLRELGYRVLEAHDGPSTLSLLERQDHVDLLFTDVVLPGGMTGAVLAREAQRLRPDLKVLFTTGYARNAIVHHGRLDPGVELITKPFSYADLAARVRDMLDGQG